MKKQTSYNKLKAEISSLKNDIYNIVMLPESDRGKKTIQKWKMKCEMSDVVNFGNSKTKGDGIFSQIEVTPYTKEHIENEKKFYANIGEHLEECKASIDKMLAEKLQQIKENK